MPSRGLRSERSARTDPLPDADPAGPAGPTTPPGPWVVVVGDTGISGPLAVRLGARHVPELPDADATAALLGTARAVVVVGHVADFETESRERRLRRARLVGVMRTVLASAGPGTHVVLVSSAMVCGTRPGGPPIADHDPVDPDVARGHGIARTLVEVERALGEPAGAPGLAQDASSAGRVAVVRCAPLAGPGVDTLVTRHFEAPRLLAVSDAAREWQFLHLDDLASAVRLVVEHGLTGVVTAGTVREDGAPDVLAADRVAELAGRRVLTLPRSTAFAIAERLHRVGAVPAPPDELPFAVDSWTVTAARLHAAGWRPVWDAEACVRAVVESGRGSLTVAGRRLGGRDAAALGAAGAAVALLGTAAAWRQARGRR